MDDPKISQSLQARLENQASEVDCTALLSEALECAIKNHYCLIIIGPAEKVIFDENLLNICKNTVRHMCIGCI